MKVGCSNILNNYYTTSFGSANVGALLYITILLDNIICSKTLFLSDSHDFSMFFY